MSRLVGKVVVITGGAGLLGRRFASAVARAGAVAVVADRDLAAAGNSAGELVGQGLKAEGVALDITSQASLETMIADLHARHGRIDAVVNTAYPRNAHYGRRLDEVTYEDFCDNVGLHLGGYFLVAQRFALYFREHGGGNIVNLSSIYGTMAPRFEVYAGTPMTMPVEYAAIKSAIIQLTRYFAQYFKSDGVRVNALSPGGILDRQPQSFLDRYNAHCGRKGMLEVDDLDGSLLFLLSDESRYVTGQNLIVDDGYSL